MSDADRSDAGATMTRAIARAAAHALVSGLIVALVWAALRWLGASDALAAGVGVAVALAPGVNDYLGRDLAGRRLSDDPLAPEPEPEDATFRTPEGTLRRAPDELLNASDFVSVSRMVSPEMVEAVAALTPRAWAALPAGDPREAEVMGALDAWLDGVPDWAVDGRLPLEAIFLAELRARLADTAGRDDAGSVAMPDDLARPARLN